MPSERYIALIALSNAKDRSMNGQVNHLVLNALNEFIDEAKLNVRGQNGGNDE